MSITSIGDKYSSHAQSVCALVNQLATIFAFDDATSVALVCQSLRGLRRLYDEKHGRLYSGNIDGLDEFLKSISVDGCVTLRRDPQHWIVDICLMNPNGEFLFVSGSLWTITLISSLAESPVILSDLPVNPNSTTSTARKRLGDILNIIKERKIGDPKESKIVLLSERVYDSLQGIQHFHAFLNKKKVDADILVLDGVSIVGKDIAEAVLPQNVATVSRSALSELRSNPNIDIVSSLDWHCPSQSSATVENIASLIKIRPAVPDHSVTRRMIFVSLDLEKRVWLEQEDALSEAIDHLQREYGVNEVLINGMTAPAGAPPGAPLFEDIFAREKIFSDRLRIKHPGLKIEHLHGKGLRDKISKVSECVYFISPAGSAALLPMICDVPGICFGTGDFLRVSKNLLPKNRDRFQIVDPSLVKEIEEDLSLKKYSWSSNTVQGRSYSFSCGDLMNILVPHAKHFLI